MGADRGGILTIPIAAADGRREVWLCCTACDALCAGLVRIPADLEMTELTLTCGRCGHRHRPAFDPAAPWAATPEDLA